MNGLLSILDLARAQGIQKVFFPSTIAVFAIHSAVAFLSNGQRAYEPLSDANHYASMLYLVWIPLAHYLLVGSWQQRMPAGRLLPIHVLLFVFAMVIAATASRVGMFILLAALAGWLLLLLK